MMIKTEKITYHDEELTYEGFVAYNDEANKKLPAIMIIHAFGGLSLQVSGLCRLGI